MELLSVIANGDAGADGLYSMRQAPAVIRGYLKAARRAKALLILDIQPGRRGFWAEALALRRWLREPDVSLALDPEWDTPGAVPGQVIGSVDAREVNAISYWLDGLVRANRPARLPVVLTRSEVEAILGRLRGTPWLMAALLYGSVNVDGFGHRAIKRAKYEHFAHAHGGLYDGFKLFFKEDTDIFKPRDVGRLHPRPDVVVYE